MTLFPLILLGGCVWISQDRHLDRMDADRDGYDFEEDCDEANADVHPGAAEACNGIDDDCDGTTDGEDAADATPWYPDADGDGYGSGAWSVTGCNAPSGYLADGTDCDDSEPGIHPGVLEVCDGVDQDCDGTTDEEATDAPTWYTDADSDGYGDPLAPLEACTLPEGAADDASDCDDGDAAIHPGALDDCDGVDDDCDDTVDNPSTWYADADDDGYGDPTVTAESCEPPSGYVADPSDCDDSRAALHPGATETCPNGLDEDCDGIIDGCAVTATLELTGGAEGLGAGWTVDAGRDATGDGQPDLLVGAGPCDGSPSAVAWLVPGPVRGGSLGTRGIPLSPTGADCGTGWNAAFVGDLDGDGHQDVAVGAPDQDGTGAVWVASGPVRDGVEPSWSLAGESTGDRLGSAVASGDLDGDGLSELILGAENRKEGGVLLGVVYIASSGDSLSLATRLQGQSSGDQAGAAVALAGDVDGDAFPDLLVGAPRRDVGGTDAGAAYLLLGPVTASLSLADAHATLQGEAENGWAGSAVSGAGDVDGDGYEDVLVGAWSLESGAPGAGAAYLLQGPLTGPLNLATADAMFTGDAGYDYTGWSLVGAGDLDADGHGDVLVGAPQFDEGARDGGGAFLWYGPLTGSLGLSTAHARVLGTDAGVQAGVSVASGGDLDGDTLPDLVVGAPWWSGSSTEEGAVLLAPGGSP